MPWTRSLPARVARLFATVARRRPRSRLAAPHARLHVRPLEERVQPAVVTWTNPTGGNWNTPGNWNTLQVPAVGDDVVIPDLTGLQTVTFSSGAATVKSLSSAEAFTLSGGTLTVTTTVQVAATFQLTGTLAKANVVIGSAFLASGGTLDGAAVTGDWSVGGGGVTVKNGLTLTGTVTLGDAAKFGDLRFAGTQTLGGTGTVVLGNGSSYLHNTTAGTTLTLGAGVTVRGVGQVGVTGAVVNLGTVVADAAGATLTLNGAGWTNAGTVRATGGGTLAITGSYAFGKGAQFQTDGSKLLFSSPYIGSNYGASLLAGSYAINATGTSTVPLLLEAPSRDRGATVGGFTSNFAVDALAVTGTSYVRLIDTLHTTSGTDPEAFYFNSLTVAAGTTIDLGGQHVYARLAQVNGTVLNGIVTVLPDSGTINVDSPAPGSISTAGQTDEWTFYGRAGQSFVVVANPGTAGYPAATAPTLGNLDVRLLNAAGTILASAVSSGGAVVTLPIVTVADAGTYRVQIKAPTGQSGLTGNYAVAVWNATVTAAPLALNQTATGTLQTRYSIDRRTFTATAGQQAQFDLINASGPGVAFSLTGPSGYTGFTDIAGDSALLTLPADGTYTLTARSVNGGTGSYSFAVRQTSVTDLTLGIGQVGTLVASGQPLLYRVTVPTNQVLSIDLTDTAPSGRTELYARFGAPPTREVYDYAAAGPGRSQSLFVPSAAPGVWYVLVYGESIPAAGPFTIAARGAGARVTDAHPTVAGNTAPVTLTVTGAGFEAGTVVELVATNGTAYAATATAIDLYTRLTATFPAGLPADTYAVRVTRAGTSDTRPAALTVTAGGVAHLETNLILPGVLGRHAVATLYVEYANTGTVAMPAPLLSLQSADADDSDKPIFTLDQDRVIQNYWSAGMPPGTSHSVLLLGSGKQAGVLNPGERIRVPVYYLGLLQPWNFSDTAVELEVRTWTATDTAAINWTSRQEALRPPLLNTEQWAAVYGNLTAGLTTTGDYVRMLDDNAAYLGRLGQAVTSVDDLWNFEVQQAYGYTAVPTLDSATDAAMPTPGVALDFARRYGNSLQSRAAVGPLGRGWFTPWQTRLVVGTGAEVVQVVGEGGAARTFQRDTRNGSYFAGTGDSGTLVALGGGVFELRAVSGTVTRFRADGKLDFVQDTNGNKVTAGYDANGRLGTLTHTSGASLTFGYNAAGLIGSFTDSAGRATTYGYDVTNTYLMTVTTADGKVTSYGYLAAGSPQVKHTLVSVGRGGITQYFTYDTRGRLETSYVAANAQHVDYGYDSTGLVTVADAAGTTSLYFDYHGLLAKTADPLGNVISNEFNSDLRLSKTVSPTGESQSFTWSSSGSMTSVTNELGQTTTFAYDNPFKRMASFTDAKGQKTEYTYDGKGNLLTTVYPNGSVEKLGNYTAAGLPGVATNRRTQTLSYTYNAAGQVTKQTFTDNTFITFDYDTRGNLLTVTDGTKVTTYTYSYATDGDRLKRVTYPNGRYLDYTYDSYGRRTRMTDQDGYQTRYEYDAAGRLWKLRDAADTLLVTYAYDPAGRLQRVDKGNGTFTTYDYDAAGQLKSLKNWRTATTLNSKFDYTYDSRGRRATMATLDGAWTYSYDGTGQLTRAVFASLDTAVIPNQDLQYFYDAAGNRTKTILNGVTTVYAANNLNQYTSVGGVGQSYDADGNLTFDGVNTYAWDQQSRLVRVSGPQGVAEYEYDAGGNRSAKVENGMRSEYTVDPNSPNGTAVA